MDYTLVVTSSNRHWLLQQTLASFLSTADIQPREIIVVEDSDAERPPCCPAHRVKFLSNGEARGQIYSIDRAYEHVNTPYIFHCEDDWAFRNTGYVQESLDILEKTPDILQVWLRGIPSRLEILNTRVIYECRPDDRGFSTVKWSWPGYPDLPDGLGFSFNPGLRRLSDYLRIGSYGRHVGYDPQGCGEQAIAKLYSDMGYKAAILPYAHTYHTGEESHVPRKLNKPAPKILLAVLTADTLDYSLFRNMQRLKWGKVWENGVSGLQIDGPNERQAAVRDTWFRDAEAHKNVTAKFFTGKELNTPDDHVHLPLKMRAVCRWMVDHDFDLMFRPDDDTFVRVDRLVRQGFEITSDYAGVDEGGFIIGGPGIWLSRRACSLLAEADVPSYETEWRDDAWIGGVLRSHGIKPGNDLPGLHIQGQSQFGTQITLHPVSPDQMRSLRGAA
jgi:hypothetical protein